MGRYRGVACSIALRCLLDRIAGLLRRARGTGVNHPLDALSLATEGVVLPRHDTAIDVFAGTRVLRRLNAHLKPKEAEIFATDIDALVALSGPDSAWHYTRHVLRQHSFGQLAWPEYLHVVASCCLCGRRFERAEALKDCRRCSRIGSAESAVLRWIIETAPDWKQRALRALIGFGGFGVLLCTITAGIIALQH